MKLTNAEIYNSKGAMEKLIQLKCPIKTSLALMKAASKLNEQLAIIDRMRIKLIQEYGAPDEKRPTIYNVTPDNPNYAAFLSDFGELMEQDVELDIEPVKLPDTLEIEPAVLMALEKFITV